MKFSVTQNHTEYLVEASTSGRFEAASREYPGAAPTVEIEDVTPDDGAFDAVRAKEQVTEELAERKRRDMRR